MQIWCLIEVLASWLSKIKSKPSDTLNVLEKRFLAVANNQGQLGKVVNVTIPFAQRVKSLDNVVAEIDSKSPKVQEQKIYISSDEDEDEIDFENIPDYEESSDPPVFRSSSSAFPNLPPNIVKTNNPTPENVTKPVSPPNPSKPPLLDSYTNVYVDGACCDNGGVRPPAGIGVWFGPDHPLNIFRRYRGRQTNNASEIEATTTAVRQAKKGGINKLRIKTDSKVVVQGITESVPKWLTNNWKTNDNRPVKNQRVYEKLINALKHMDVIWKHVPEHEGIDGNENADRLAREGALMEPES
ncbi:ribonuclease H1-like [Leptopilina boulardi]|uniref:ribonuclease H1-like n=1 Tax=Leptopilina boulardi TaxID=63433 RepID=UPI0021F5B14E|nr:ribonuclease H1-like [Leptopilina boulardi]